ncbi:PPC domain-containing DNA-binding protein [Stetteria hydrogenophila]
MGVEGIWSAHAVGRVFFLKVPTGRNPRGAVEELLRLQGVRAALIQGLGGFRRVKLAVYSPAEGRYHAREFEARPGMVIEAACVTGNSVLGPGGRYYTHLHAVVAVEPGVVAAGHLVEGVAEPFLELAVAELAGGYEALATLLSHRWGGSGSPGSPSSPGSSP